MPGPVLKYNPAFLSEEELVRSFTVRQTDLELLLESIRENTAASNQHLLVVGPRGMGKTTLVRRAAAAVRADQELGSRWYPILFGEEAYEVGTPGEFWLEAIYFAAKQLDEDRWQQIHAELKGERDERRLCDRALAHLMDLADRQGKRLLLVVENLNLLLGEQIDHNAAWTLRHTLQNEPRVMLLATATSRFEETERADRAMYELFRVQDLRPLDTEECRALWEARTGGARLEGNRIRPIEILTGGNPRLLVILASFAPEDSLRTLMDELIHLVDEHTSYFKANLEVLPAIERKVFVMLADLWRPATAREVADGARLDVNKVSALLHRLVERGAVTVVSQRARAKRYQVAERLYNIYHLMRRGGEPSQRVRHVVEFMHALYEPDQLVRATIAIAREACGLGPGQREDHYHAYLAILCRVEAEERRRIVEATEPGFFQQPDAPEELCEWVTGTDISYEDASAQMAKWEARAEELYRQVEASPTSSGWFDVGLMLCESQHRWEDAEAAFREALTLDPDNFSIRLNLQLLLFQMGRNEEGEEVFKGLPRVEGLKEVVETPGNLRREGNEEGKEVFEASSLESHSFRAWYPSSSNTLRMFLLVQLGRWEEATDVAARILAIRSDIDALPVLIETFCCAAAAGQGRRFLDVIERSMNADLLEPLVVAIRMDAGEEPEAAQEISEVARDLCLEIIKRRKLSAEWASLQITPASAPVLSKPEA